MERTITAGIRNVRTTVWILMCLSLFLCLCMTRPAPAATPEFKVLAAAPAAAKAPRPSHLDLRPPAAGELAGLKAAAAESRHVPLDAEDDFAGGHRHVFPAFAAAAAQPALVGRAEAFAQRFRHEGLPLARLWENHAAFVSVGLGPRGRPGIWLVQKTH